MAKFIRAVRCPVCDSMVKESGFFIDLMADEHVICLNNFSDESFHCDNCGTDIHIGDVEEIMDFETEEDYAEEDDAEGGIIE